MAPLQRRGQRLLAGRRGVAAGAQQAEAVVEPLGDRCRAEHADASGGELECERQAVEAEADARDVLRVLVVELEARARRPPRGRRRARRTRTRAAVPGGRCPVGARDVERRDAEDDLSGHAQRLAARRDDRQLRAQNGAACRESAAVAPSSARSCRARAAACAPTGSRSPRRRRRAPAARARRAHAATVSGIKREHR